MKMKKREVFKISARATRGMLKMKDGSEAVKEIEEMWDKCNYSLHPKFWKFGALEKKRLEYLMYSLTREVMGKYAKRLDYLGLINLRNLQPKEQKILEMVYFDLLSFEEVAEEFGLTKERIRQLVEKAVGRLRDKKEKDTYEIVK